MYHFIQKIWTAHKKFRIAQQNGHLRALKWSQVKFPEVMFRPILFVDLARKVDMCLITKDQNFHARSVARFLAPSGKGFTVYFMQFLYNDKLIRVRIKISIQNSSIL